MNDKKIKWQGSHWKRASHAFLIDADSKPGQVSLCGRETLTTSEAFDKPQVRACGNCVKKTGND